MLVAAALAGLLVAGVASGLTHGGLGAGERVVVWGVASGAVFFVEALAWWLWTLAT